MRLKLAIESPQKSLKANSLEKVPFWGPKGDRGCPNDLFHIMLNTASMFMFLSFFRNREGIRIRLRQILVIFDHKRTYMGHLMVHQNLSLHISGDHEAIWMILDSICYEIDVRKTLQSLLDRFNHLGTHMGHLMVHQNLSLYISGDNEAIWMILDSIYYDIDVRKTFKSLTRSI